MGREGWREVGKNEGRKKEKEKTCPNHGFLKVAEYNGSLMYKILSSVFLIRISCHKTTHVNGYHGAWPGWAVSISVLPLTIS